MAIPWGLLTFVVGLLYGWLSPGRQDRRKMLWNGLLIGVVVALVLGLLGYFTKVDPLGLGTGIVGIFLTILILTVLFVLGTWVGDLIEGARRRHA